MNNTIHYDRVQIKEARKLWEQGEKIYCLPIYSKSDFELDENGDLMDGIHLSVFTSKEKDNSFDEFVKTYKSVSRNNMRYYIQNSNNN